MDHGMHQALLCLGLFFLFISTPVTAQTSLQSNPLFLDEATDDNATWLKNYVAIRKHPESETGSLMDTRLAYAIKQLPAASLQAIQAYQKYYQEYFKENFIPHYAELVCGLVKQDWLLGSDQSVDGHKLIKGAIRELERRQKALIAIGKQAPDDTRRACLSAISHALTFWQKW